MEQRKAAKRKLIYAGIFVAGLTLAACGDKSDAVQTTPPQGGQAAPAPAAAPASATAPAAAGRQGGAAPATAPITVAQHAATMKTIAQNVGVAGKALKGGDAAAATPAAEALVGAFTTIETFYTQRSKPEAVKLAQTARSGAQDTLTALKAGDTMKAQAALTTTQGTCAQCHKMFREGDGKTTPYGFNAASGITAP
jgi:hypothetical protein